MSNKNFVSYGDAAEVLAPFANGIKAATPTEITYAQWLQLTPQQQESGNYIVQGWPGGQSTTPQPDWEESDQTADDYIKNKPTLGTAAAKDATDNVRPGSHDLVESNAVFSAINNAMSSIYHVRGDITVAELTSSLLVAANVGNIYELSDSGVTTALFIQGAGETLNVGDNVGIIQAGESTYLFNHMAGAFDMHDYQKKDLTTPLTITGSQQTTVEGALGKLKDYVNYDNSERIRITSTTENVSYHLLTITANSYTSLNLHVTDRVGNVFDISVNGTAAPLAMNTKYVTSGEGVTGMKYRNLTATRVEIIFRLSGWSNAIIRVTDNYKGGTHPAYWTIEATDQSNYNEATGTVYVTRAAFANGGSIDNGYNKLTQFDAGYPNTLDKDVSFGAGTGLYLVIFYQGAGWYTQMYLLDVTRYHATIAKRLTDTSTNNPNLSVSLKSEVGTNPCIVNFKTTVTYSGNVYIYKIW